MTGILEKLALYWGYPFVRYALAVGVLIALCASLLGVTLVLKRFSFIGDGLSHVAFGAMAVSGVLGLTNDMPLVMAITIVSAVLLLKTGQNRKIQGDAAVAMISVGALALGYLLMNLFSTSGNLSGDVCSTLFGSTSILTLSLGEVWLSVAMSALVVLIFVLFYNKIFAVTFDENFAKAAGTAADRYNLLIAVTVAVVIVLAMNLVGSLLISALVIFPALSAMGVFKSFRSVTICSAVLSTVCAALGILIAILAGTPVGSTIVAVDILAFSCFPEWAAWLEEFVHETIALPAACRPDGFGPGGLREKGWGPYGRNHIPDNRFRGTQALADPSPGDRGKGADRNGPNCGYCGKHLCRPDCPEQHHGLRGGLRHDVLPGGLCGKDREDAGRFQQRSALCRRKPERWGNGFCLRDSGCHSLLRPGHSL